MHKAITLLVAAALVGCASVAPQPADPSSEPQPSVMAPPEPQPSVDAENTAMFTERLRQALSVVVAAFLSPDYRDAE